MKIKNLKNKTEGSFYCLGYDELFSGFDSLLFTISSRKTKMTTGYVDEKGYWRMDLPEFILFIVLNLLLAIFFIFAIAFEIGIFIRYMLAKDLREYPPTESLANGLPQFKKMHSIIEGNEDYINKYYNEKTQKKVLKDNLIKIHSQSNYIKKFDDSLI
jgi:hypothetical protein